ncbi:unnamed protein product, partial [Ilex paraguariensis]
LSYVEKMELGRKMVKYCGGLPLAVVVLGGLLATKETLSEWDMVHKNVKSHLSRGKSTEHGGRVVDILALSYDDLPYQLKPCFLYLGNFKEDSEIEVERLYQLWIAEGMVPSDDRLEEETMMDVAERYLGELAHRCMVRVQLEEESTIRKFISCRLHDLMRELCLSKGKEDNFLKFIDYQHGDDDEQVESYASTNNTRRLVIYLGEEDVSQYVPPKKETVRHLRSLLVFVSDEYEGRMSRMMKSQFNNFKMLRVLAIEGLSSNLTDTYTIEALGVIIDHWKLSKGIGNLIHLRYLSLRGSACVNFPSSIGNLKNLQTLDLRIDILFLWNVNVLRKMGRLRHLYLPHFYDIDHMFVVEKVRLDDLSKLEILENFDAAYCVVKDLFKLINLRELTARVEKLEDLRAIMKHVGNIAPNHLRNLSLRIECRFCSEDELTLLTQLLGCPLLQKLEIVGLIGKLPEHTHFSSSLTQLSLYGSELEKDPMATLEKLPNLHKVDLGIDVFIGEEIVCSAMGFPQLKNLELWLFPNLQKWRVDKGAMPNLSTLEIRSCKKLQRVPEGLKFVTTLQELVIGDMPNEFNERIRIVDGQEGEDFDRVRHIPSIVIW